MLLVFNNEGEGVEGVWHHMADDNAGPRSMATTHPTQFPVTWASVGKKICGRIFRFMYAAAD